MFIATMVVVVALIVVMVIQLTMMILFEHPYGTERLSRMVIYILMIGTMLYRFYLYAEDGVTMTLPGLGVGATATLALIALEYVRWRETGIRL